VVEILQVLLFRDSETSGELGPVLWAAIKEVESLFNRDPRRMTFRRAYLAAEVPEVIRAEVDGDHTAIESALKDARRWDRTRGQYSRTYDQNLLAEFARELLGARDNADFLILVTDVEITPPAGWRYIIWDGCRNGSVLSVAPVDPAYWGSKDRDRDRLMTIKQRVRAGCCSMVGESMGLGRCTNPQCFLYGDVESAGVLDQMVYLGGEHRIAALTRRGFATEAADPAAVQEVIQYPISTEGGVR